MDGGAAPECVDDAFFRLSSDLLAVTDAALLFLRLNPAWKDQLGFTSDALVRRSLIDVICPRDRARVVETLAGCIASACARGFDAGVLRANQTIRQAHFTASPSPDKQRLYVVAHDVTVRQRLERELASAQKLEAIGQLSAGIAHEINTPIQFVGDNLSFLGDAFVRAQPMLELLVTIDFKRPVARATLTELADRIAHADLAFATVEIPLSILAAREGVERVAQLVKSLREFAHPDSEKMAPADLKRAIERTVAVARSEWKYIAEVKLELTPLPQVRCQLSAINQVLLNLLCNAAHAIGEKQKKQGKGAPRGTIRISTSSDGHFATIAVSDTGAGIPASVRARIFEPFFTTKEVGRGTGQGLAISRTIICEKHKGRLDFDSEEGVGSTFYVRLPLHHEEGEAA